MNPSSFYYIDSKFLLPDVFFNVFRFSFGVYSACCKCANLECGGEYDMDLIETQLIDMVQKQSMAFVLQDLKCVKCRGVRIC